jgi:hypothetical protein
VEAQSPEVGEVKKGTNDEFQKMMNEKNEVVLDITCKEEGFTTKLPTQKEKTIRDVFATLTKKLKKLNPRDYFMQLPSEDPGNPEESKMVELNLPVGKLPYLRLEVVRRSFADEPKSDRASEPRRPAEDSKRLSQIGDSEEQFMYLYNQLSASKYEVTITVSIFDSSFLIDRSSMS